MQCLKKEQQQWRENYERARPIFDGRSDLSAYGTGRIYMPAALRSASIFLAASARRAWIFFSSSAFLALSSSGERSFSSAPS
ncbi:hypothetical protein BE221DRAFT_67293 [Ostreococcus tauri]|uniref:Uncharacterized protein n=1 Tax=Ostreococcus tauri TaxID=70448 RepID=A0A1Y5IHG7_OSTTA|nr:hypothetical protein BE221DRAFT_67293 [Ostreococcus tauri]